MIDRLRVSDKDEITELRKRLTDCMQENKKLKKEIASIPNVKFDLSDRQKAIIEFIKTNPGKNKEDIIRKLTQDSKGSLMTIRKDIKILEEEYKMIISRKDVANRWISQYYLNEENILLDTYNKLNDFKKHFIETIDKIILDKNWIENIENNNFNIILSSLILIYTHTLNTYITYILLEWSNKFQNDTTLLNKLFSLIFFTFVEINLKLINSFHIPHVKPLTGLSTPKEILSPLSQGFLYKQFLLKPHIILNMLKEHQKINLHEYLFPLLESVWKLSYPIYENIKMFGPSSNEIKLRTLKQIYYTDSNLPLLLFHYIRDHCNKINPKTIRFPEPSLIPPSFDTSLRLDEDLYKNILLETLGQKKYSELNREFLVNELARFVEYLQDLNYKKEQITGWEDEYPDDKTFKIKCRKHVKAIDNYISNILESKTISNVLNIYVKRKEAKSEQAKKLQDSLTIDSLNSFFNELDNYRNLEKEMNETYDKIWNDVKIKCENES